MHLLQGGVLSPDLDVSLRHRALIPIRSDGAQLSPAYILSLHSPHLGGGHCRHKAIACSAQCLASTWSLTPAQMDVRASGTLTGELTGPPILRGSVGRGEAGAPVSEEDSPVERPWDRALLQEALPAPGGEMQEAKAVPLLRHQGSRAHPWGRRARPGSWSPSNQENMLGWPPVGTGGLPWMLTPHTCWPPMGIGLLWTLVASHGC